VRQWSVTKLDVDRRRARSDWRSFDYVVPAIMRTLPGGGRARPSAAELEAGRVVRDGPDRIVVRKIQ
jgi:hypothetical protein